MTRLAVIATLYGERGTARLPDLIRAVEEQTRQPDEVWWCWEGGEDELPSFFTEMPFFTPTVKKLRFVTPRDDSGRYAVIPYSHKINYALDRTTCDYVAYLTDDSLPHPEKYERLVRALEEHPAVYVGQRRNGSEHPADRVVKDAYCVLDHTQVAHRLTADRWPTEIGDMLLGDAVFWRRLHASLGPFYPVEGGILDEVQQTPDGITGSWR